MTYFLDLFSGIGGFALGAYWAGLRFDGHYYSEVDDYAIRVYQQRFPDAVGLGDIRKINGRDLPQGDWIIAGGFPCQDISVAGKGAGLAGARSGLWYEYARLISELRPRYAIMENVGALSFRGLDSVLGSLAEIGYDAEWQDIRASDVGAPHRRERLWIVGYPHDDGFNGSQDRKSTIEGSNSNQTWPRELVESKGSGSTGQADVADATSESADRYSKRAPASQSMPRNDSETLADTSNGGNVRRDGELGTTQEQVREPRRSAGNGCGEWWEAEPDVRSVVDGLPPSLDRYQGRTCLQSFERVNQLKCLGNSIVPQIAEIIFSQSAFDELRLAPAPSGKE